MKFIAIFALLTIAVQTDILRNDPVKESRKKHDYKLTLKRPYLYIDNVTVPFYDVYGCTTFITYCSNYDF
jgi:hypothetical protein